MKGGLSSHSAFRNQIKPHDYDCAGENCENIMNFLLLLTDLLSIIKREGKGLILIFSASNDLDFSELTITQNSPK